MITTLTAPTAVVSASRKYYLEVKRQACASCCLPASVIIYVRPPNLAYLAAPVLTSPVLSHRSPCGGDGIIQETRSWSFPSRKKKMRKGKRFSNCCCTRRGTIITILGHARSHPSPTLLTTLLTQIPPHFLPSFFQCNKKIYIHLKCGREKESAQIVYVNCFFHPFSIYFHLNDSIAKSCPVIPGQIALIWTNHTPLTKKKKAVLKLQ